MSIDNKILTWKFILWLAPIIGGLLGLLANYKIDRLQVEKINTKPIENSAAPSDKFEENEIKGNENVIGNDNKIDKSNSIKGNNNQIHTAPIHNGDVYNGPVYNAPVTNITNNNYKLVRHLTDEQKSKLLLIPKNYKVLIAVADSPESKAYAKEISQFLIVNGFNIEEIPPIMMMSHTYVREEDYVNEVESFVIDRLSDDVLQIIIQRK
ncbi:hypothetical protein FMM05_12505 [Flavobacterium zepuense]|uniref:Uncharacterized protein n=1 Tax=Flavobacterium zepuense TaxID=2593302 RepID=A0A552V0L5_9FLAO|nr:hypothetical protein [Flavobacterium zepuense]TRW23972.1 hypothetical protein FMM05_12505 [Flavobacterium zepuense]